MLKLGYFIRVIVLFCFLVYSPIKAISNMEILVERNKMKLVTISILLLLAIPFSVFSEEVVNPHNCANVELKSVKKSLSKEEQLRLLDNTFVDSIDAYAECITTSQAQSAQAGSGAGGGSDSGEQGNLSEQANNNSESQIEENASAELSEDQTSQAPTNTNTTPVNSGAKNKLVAPKDNDLIVCQMLWDEINQESNEQTKAELTKQYKDYQCG